jgi:hypothetical protein
MIKVYNSHNFLEITEGDKKEQKFVATVLYYEFTIKNIENKKLEI